MKLYSDEPGDAVVRGIERLVISQIARVEVPAAVWRKQRTGMMTPDEAGDLTNRFAADFLGRPTGPPRFGVIALSVELLEEAARLCAVHGLRAYDGVQLSSALAARRVEPRCSTVAAFDRALRAAATTEGFALLPTLAD